MSHFTVMVIGSNPDQQLAKYDENIEMEPFVKYTKAEYIEKLLSDRKVYEETNYKEYLSDPDEYVLKYGGNIHHIEYLRDLFPKMLLMNGEELYNQYVDGDNENVNENGDIMSTYNPNSKWDWYTLGGRWAGMLQLKNGETADGAEFSEIANFDTIKTFAIVKDGIWYEKGEMGWWAMVSNEKEETEWETIIAKLTKDLEPDTLISIFDCHI